MRVLLRLAVVLVAVGCVPVATAGATALDGLSPQGCVSNAALSGCTTLPGELGGASLVAVSPDGASVYAAGDGSTVVAFSRTPAGVLTPQGCFSNAALGGCTTLPGELNGVRSVAVSPDGASVYAASEGSNTVVAFSRGPTGTLTPKGCFSNAALSGCTTLPDELDGASSVTVSPDGASVYVANAGEASDRVTTSTLVTFSRAPTGTLTPQGCFDDEDVIGGCSPVTGELTEPETVTVSPDGASVYVASGASSAVVAFSRAPTGTLTPQGCFSSAALAGCTTLAGELSGVFSVAVSPDGASVYAVTDGGAGTVVAFSRTLTGTLTPQGCFSNAALSGCTTLSGQLVGLTSVAVSPDGASVYAASNGGGGGAVVAFSRAPAGTLTPQSCFSNAALSGCTTLAGELSGAFALAVSPDDASVYAASIGAGAIVAFARQLAPICRGTTSSGAAGAPQLLTLDCRDPNGDPVTIAVTRSPRHGTLGPVDQSGHTVTYTPAAGFDGADDIAVHASSDAETSDDAVVAITVTPPPPSGPVGPAGPAGAAGSAGAAGPTGPAGTSRLIALLTATRATLHHGHALKLGFVATAAGTATLTVRKGKKTVATTTRRLTKAGRATLTLAASHTRKLARGSYTLHLSFAAATTGTPATDSIPLTISR